MRTPSFLRDTAKFDGDERGEIVAYLGLNPEAGEILAETGGVRKLRWKAPGRGKRGGFRVVYYYHDDSLPSFLLNLFAKNEKSNLSAAERNAMKMLLPRLVAGYKRRIVK